MIRFLILFLASLPLLAGEFSHQLRTDPPRTGRVIAGDGSTINEADLLRSMPVNIARGLLPGAEPISAFGERITAGAESKTPVWPDGAIKLAPAGGAQLYVVSTSAQDAPGGTGIGYLDVHYVDRDGAEVDSLITMAGLTPVPLPQRARFVQCAHTDERQAAYAAGVITIQDIGAGVYSQIAAGETRCSSSFRIVPRGKVLYIDGAIGSSTSLTADTTTILRLVANEIYGHRYTNPLVFIPIASIGIQNGATGFTFPVPLRLQEGSIIGCNHTSNKAATIGCSWFGRLEPAP